MDQAFFPAANHRTVSPFSKSPDPLVGYINAADTRRPQSTTTTRGPGEAKQEKVKAKAAPPPQATEI